MKRTVYTPATQTKNGTTNTVAGYLIQNNLPIPPRVGRGGSSKWRELYRNMNVGSAVEMSQIDAQRFIHTIYAAGGRCVSRKQENGNQMVWLIKDCTHQSWAR